MKITNTNTKQILVGISISLSIALSGCGSDGSATSALDTYGKESRAVVTDKTHNSAVNTSETTHNTINVGFDYNSSDPLDTGWDGFYVHVMKLPWGTTQAQVDAMSLDEYNCTEAYITHNKDDRNITAYNLDANSTYALITGSFLKYTVATVHKTDILCDSAVVETTKAAPTVIQITAPCLNVTGWMNQEEKVFKSRWANGWVFGAHPTWCFDKDESGESIYDGANLYRALLDTETGLFGTPELIVADDGGEFDTERDYFDCPLVEDATYQYTLQAYTLDTDGNKVYHDNNATAEITLDPNVIPERECEECIPAS